MIIRKEKLKIHTSDEQYAFRVRKQLNDSLQFDLITVMEKVFAQIESPGVYTNIDKIKIDLGTITPEDFEQHFVQLVESKLISELRKQIPQDSSTPFASEEKNDPGFDLSNVTNDPLLQFNSARQQSLIALLYFLENGIYPWWYKKEFQKTPAELLDTLTKDETESLILKILSTRKRLGHEEVKNIIKRLFIHLPKAKNESVVRQLLDLHNTIPLTRNIRELIKNKDDLKQFYSISERDFYTRLFGFLMSENIEAAIDTIKNFIAQLKNEQKANVEPMPSAKEKQVLEKRRSATVTEEGIYISNAGLVLVHPYLQSFFAEAGLLDEKNQFISVPARQKATVLLYYLQCGNEEYHEWEMALNKILSGMQYDELVPDGIRMTENEKEECRSLLQAVVNHWEALKGASIESMQNTFFLREGKITWKENHWLLQIERTGFDILIDRLPWSLTTIKLPWLEHLIFTEW